MALRQFEDWLEKGKSLANDLAQQQVSLKRKKTCTPGCNVRWRKKDSNGYLVTEQKRLRSRSAPRESTSKAQLSSSIEVEHPQEDGMLAPHASTSRAQDNEYHPEEHNLEFYLNQLADLIASTDVPSPTQEEPPLISEWAKRQQQLGEQMKTIRPVLLNSRLSGQKVCHDACQMCDDESAVIRCMDCVPSGHQFLCSLCDVAVHERNVFHNRETMLEGFFNPVPPTLAVVKDDDGHLQVCKQVRLLPLAAPKCSCSSSALTLSPGKQILLVTFNGPYRLHLPTASCATCSTKWTPSLSELIKYRYWPATPSCQTLYTFDVLRSFEQIKNSSPAFSQQAFLRMLENRAVQNGREGTICGDAFHRSFREFAYCSFQEGHMCMEQPFVCPACTPDMLAVSVDGNRKHYRFLNSKGTDETALFDGTFIAKDREVEVFVDHVRSQMPSRSGASLCGSASFKAGKETSCKSHSKIDEEGLQVAVCRHGLLLRALNHYRGEIFAYPMFIQKEVSSTSNVNFFCMDVTCKYWPYLAKVAQKIPELLPLTNMKPFLSIMHAKAHTSKCEVQWGGRSQLGAGNTIGEEVEQVNSFLSKAALTTKYMSKAGRNDMLTVLGIGWNRRKVDGLHKALARRFTKACERALTEQSNLEDLKKEHNLADNTVEEWVFEVRQWAETERASSNASQDELQQEIEALIYSFKRKKHNLYRDNDSNKSRQATRQTLNKIKTKLKDTIIMYNGKVSEDDKIDFDEACSLSESFQLPWETQGGGLRLKRQVFDQVMLVSRLQEEKDILLHEMMRHCTFLRKKVDQLNGRIVQIIEDLSNHVCPEELTKEGYQGLHCCLLYQQHLLKQHLQQVTGTYMRVATKTFVWSDDVQDGSDAEDSDSEMSGNDSDTQ